MKLHLPTTLRRALLAAIVTVSALSSAAMATVEPTLIITDEERNDSYTEVETANISGMTDLAGATGSITGTGEEATSFNARGHIQIGTNAAAEDGSVSAFHEIRLGSQTVASEMEIFGDVLVNDNGGFSADYEGTVHITGDLGATSGATVEVADNMQLTLDGTLLTTDGKLNIIGALSELNLTAAQELTGTDISVEGTMNSVGLSSTGATTHLTGENALLHGEEGDILLSGVTTIDTGAQLDTTDGDLTLHGASYLSNATLTAGEGTLHIVTSEADYTGSMTTIRNTELHADKAVILEGEEGNLATVTGSTHITSAGEDVAELKNGGYRLVGMVFNNVQFESLSGEDDVAASDGDILIQNSVTLKDAVLTTTGTTEARRGELLIDGDSVLELKSGGDFDAGLRSVEDSAALLLSDARHFVLREDSRDYNGRILAYGGDGSQVTVDSVGLGERAITMLRDNNFNVTAEAYLAEEPVQVGSISTVMDEGQRNTTAGELNEFLIDGSYTMDDNTRLGYRNIGSILDFDRGTAGTETMITSLRLSPYTLLWEDIALNEDGTVSADRLVASGESAANNARVFATLGNRLLGDAPAAEAAIADGTRAEILSGALTTGFNEDVLYDMEPTENGTYQRVLRTLNVHLENDEETGAALVFSKNFRGVEGGANENAVAGVLAALADTVDHTEGTLAASENPLHRLLDSLDYTRSGAAAAAALQSLSGTGNTIVQQAALDASSHHLDTLRSRITMPTPCTWEKGMREMPERRNDLWMVYEGGYDHLSSQAAMGAYSRTFQGLLLGYDRQLCCNATLGIAFGYENAISRSSGCRAEDDTYFIDLYSGVRTGKLDHKFSVGVGLHDFDTTRSVSVSAPGHDFLSSCTGSADATAINVGYELSYDYELSDKSVVTPYLDVNYAYIDLDNLRESGEAGVTTDFDSLNLLQVALGARMDRRFTGLAHQDRGTLTFSAQAVGEFSERRPSALNRFNFGEGDSFRVNSLKRAPFYGQIGVNAILPLSAHWDMIGGAYGRLGHDRGSVAGNVGLRCSF